MKKKEKFFQKKDKENKKNVYKKKEHIKMHKEREN